MEKSKSRRDITEIKPMQKLKKKLGTCAGETIAETLVALLIAALALTMLAGAMSSSLKMVTKSRNKLKGYNEKMETMAKMEGANTGTVTIEANPADASLDLPEYQVQYDYNDEFDRTPVVVYRYADPASSP